MSSDELADFDTHSPQVAGPSTSNKRKQPADSKRGSRVTKRKAEELTEHSSDNGPPPRQTARRGKSASANIAVNGHVNGRARLPSKRKVNSASDKTALAGESMDEDEETVERKTPLSKVRKGNAADRSLERLQRMHDEILKQRDEFASQFKQLSQLRHTDPEKLLHEQKIQYEARLKAQQDTIHELQTALNRLDTFENSGRGHLHFLTREAAERERQDVQREVSKLRNALKEKETILSEKDKEVVRLNDTIKTLRSDLELEIENSKRLVARTAPLSLSKASGKLDSRNALIVRLYEELTGVLITNVKHDTGKFKDDDAIFTCVQTARDRSASLHFTLKYSTDTNEDASVVPKVIYTPFNLDKESPAFIEQLDFLAKPFTFERDQMQVFSQTLTSHLEGNNGDDNDHSRTEE